MNIYIQYNTLQYMDSETIGEVSQAVMSDIMQTDNHARGQTDNQAGRQAD